MNYIIYGAGHYGALALEFIGEGRIVYFADTYNYGGTYFNRDILSVSQMVDYYNEHDDIIVIIANQDHSEEMVQTLQRLGVERHLVYDDTTKYRLPRYYLYRKIVYPSLGMILARNHINAYEKIVVYGDNKLTPYVFMELWEQCPRAEIYWLSNADTMKKFGIKNIDMNTALHSDAVFVVTSYRYESEIYQPLQDSHISKERIIDIYAYERIEPAFCHPELKRYKNIHKGKRAFVIGTGPSLTVDDLNTLHEHHEICLSCNKIYRIYENTAWRADYIALSDCRVLNDCFDELPNVSGTIFVPDTFHTGVNNIYPNIYPNIYYYHIAYEDYLPYMPAFSQDISDVAYCGYTITYDFNLQFAAYMGIKEIFLLGVDHSYSKNVTEPRNDYIV